jgi:hypothetical protein
VGVSFVGGIQYPIEWSGGSVVNLGGPPGPISYAYGINDAGQAVGVSGNDYATEWSDSQVINLGKLLYNPIGRGVTSVATSINDAGLVVGRALGVPLPESSTWAMMLFGFAGLTLAGYRRARAGHAAPR